MQLLINLLCERSPRPLGEQKHFENAFSIIRGRRWRGWGWGCGKERNATREKTENRGETEWLEAEKASRRCRSHPAQLVAFHSHLNKSNDKHILRVTRSSELFPLLKSPTNLL